MKSVQGLSLASKLVLLVVAVSTVTTLTAGAVIYEQSKRMLMRNVDAHLRSHVDNLAEELDAFNRNWLGMGELLANVPLVADSLTEGPQMDVDRQRAQRFLHDLVSREPRIQVISVFGLDGVVKLSSEPRVVGVSAMSRSYTKRALEGVANMSTLFMSTYLSPPSPLVAYASPVRSADGKLIGFIGVFVRASTLWDTVTRFNNRIWNGSYVVVLDDFGVRIAHGMQRAQLFHPAAPLKPQELEMAVAEERFGPDTKDFLSQVIAEPLMNEWARSKEAIEPTVARVEPSQASTSARYATARRLGTTGWTIASVVPAEVIDTQVLALTRSLALASIGILIVAFMLALLFSRTLLRPLSALVSASSAIGRGERVGTLEVNTRDEIGQLVAQFNEMSAAIEEGRTKLETRVEARTADLTQANRELTAQRAELESQRLELEQQNREIDRANQMKSAFLANMSHELRTPLNSVIGFTDLLSEELGPTLTATHRRFLDDILSSGKHLLNLINDILDLSKIEAGHLELHREPVLASQAMEEALGLVRAQALRKKVALITSYKTERSVDADPDKLRQVLLNLLSNAVKFSNDDSKVTVGVEDAGSAVRFWVRDEGPGIDPALMPRLFEPFVQGENHLVKRHQGTGLGLSICKRLVERHGGTLAVESTPGHGALFSFVIDRAIAQPTPAAGTKPSVLLIELVAERAKQLRERLVDAGYDVCQPMENEDPAHAVRRLRPSVLLLDPTVEGRSGLELLSGLRDDPETRRLPIVFTTAPRTAGVIAKPLDPEVVLSVVQHTLQMRASASKQVLMVDDDPRARELLKSILAPRGYEVHTANDGKEALQRLNVMEPAVILTDLLMPELSGFELVEMLANGQKTRDIPVIVLTALDLTKEQRERLKRHVFATARKGDITSNEVVVAVERATRTQPLSVEASDTILVVDDHDLNRQLARAFLERRGYKVIEADGGQRAIDLALEQRPGLVLMDLAMPEMDGYAALAALRARPETKHIPVVALTALALREDEERARAAGFNDYVTKPIDQRLLLGAVEKVFRARAQSLSI